MYVVGVILSVGLALNVVFLFRLGSRRRVHLAPPSEARACPWTVREAFGLFGALAVCHALLYVILVTVSKVGELTDNGMSIVAFVGHLCLFHGVILIYAAVILRRKNERLADLFGIAGKDVLRHAAHGIAYYMAAMPAVLLAGWVYAFFLSDWGYPVGPDDVQDIVQLFLDPDFPYAAKIVAAAAAVTLVPVAEEILFRSVALRVLAQRTSRHVAVLFVSLCFAILHMHVPSLVPLFVFSIALSWGYMHTGSLAVPIVMHSAFNTVAILSSMTRASNAGA
mgnify:FL=1